MPECACPLTFCSAGLFNTIPILSYLLNFYHSSLVHFLCMLSIHNNLSAGTQNVTGAYIIIMLVYMAKQLYDSK